MVNILTLHFSPDADRHNSFPFGVKRCIQHAHGTAWLPNLQKITESVLTVILVRPMACDPRWSELKPYAATAAAAAAYSVTYFA